MRSAILGLIAAAIISLASPAMADRKEDWNDCGQSENDDLTIGGCTRVRALAHSNRASAYQNKKDYDRAIAYRDKKNYERAIADFDQAIKLDPKMAEYWNGRCWARAIANRGRGERLRHGAAAGF